MLKKSRVKNFVLRSRFGDAVAGPLPGRCWAAAEITEGRGRKSLWVLREIRSDGRRREKRGKEEEQEEYKSARARARRVGRFSRTL